jgi:hypothetical protein
MSEMQETYHSLTSPLARRAPHWSRHGDVYHVSVTRPHQRDALDAVYKHLETFVSGMTEGQISGYLLHMSHDDCGHTVQGAVIYKDNEPEPERNLA